MLLSEYPLLGNSVKKICELEKNFTNMINFCKTILKWG